FRAVMPQYDLILPVAPSRLLESYVQSAGQDASEDWLFWAQGWGMWLSDDIGS
ncbi:hypothetical protein BgiMline_025165, partial [Biomphalaria glabrata]